MADLSDVITFEWAPASDPFATSPTWVDITASPVRGGWIRRGRSGVFDLYGAGAAQIVVANPAGAIDPTVWHRWRQVRITATATGPASNVLFRGFVHPTVRHDQSLAPFDAVAIVDAIDLLGIIARYEYIAASVPAERSGARVTRILDAIGVPSAWRSVATGYIDLAALDDGVYNALALLQDVVEAEVGALYVTAAGVVTFADRYDLLANLAGAAAATFSDAPSGSDIVPLFGNTVLAPPGQDYRNRVTFTGDSGISQTASNVPSNFPPDSLSRSVPIASDGQAMSNANYLLDVYRQSGVIHPESLSLSVWPESQNTVDVVSALDLRDYCTVEFTPMGKTQQTYKVFAESFNHTFAPMSWRASLGFSSADRWEDGWGDKNDYLILDDATYGKLDTGKLGP